MRQYDGCRQARASDIADEGRKGNTMIDKINRLLTTSEMKWEVVE